MPAFVRHIREKTKTSSTAPFGTMVPSMVTNAPGTKMIQSNRDATYTNELSTGDVISLQDTRTSHTDTNPESKASFFEIRDLARAMV